MSSGGTRNVEKQVSSPLTRLELWTATPGVVTWCLHLKEMPPRWGGEWGPSSEGQVLGPWGALELCMQHVQRSCALRLWSG